MFYGFGVALAGSWPLWFTASPGHAGTQAALLLARTDDQRVVEPLARLWIPNPWTAYQKHVNAEISGELLRLLTERQGARYNANTEQALRELVHRALPKPGSAAYLLRRSVDLAERDTDLLLTILRHLSHTTDNNSVRSDIKADEEALRHAISENSKQESLPHRALLRDTAQELLTVSAQKGTP